MNIFVSNINYATREEQLQELFSEYGEVLSAKVITDRETGRSRGFGFVEMNDEDGANAIEQLNQYEFQGKMLNVSEAKPREDRGSSPRGGSGGGYNNSRGGGRDNNRGGGGGGRW